MRGALDERNSKIGSTKATRREMERERGSWREKVRERERVGERK